MKIKKVLSMVVCLCILVSTFAFSAYATTVNDCDNVGLSQTGNNKISPKLALKIESSTDETTLVDITLKSCYSVSEVEQYVYENYEDAREDVLAYIKYYRQEVANRVTPYLDSFIEDNKDFIESVLVKPDSAEFIIANLYTDKIEELAENELVIYLDYWENAVQQPGDSTTNPEENPSEPITSEPITTEPITTEPVTTEPVTTEESQPVTTEVQPTTTVEPTTVAVQPAPTTPKPVVKPAKAKKTNPIKVTVKYKTLKAKSLKKKNAVVSAITVKKAQGKVVYSKISGNKNFSINKSTGKITVKKGTKANTYKVKVKITAKGNSKYKSASITAIAEIKIK